MTKRLSQPKYERYRSSVLIRAVAIQSCPAPIFCPVHAGDIYLAIPPNTRASIFWRCSPTVPTDRSIRSAMSLCVARRGTS